MKFLGVLISILILNVNTIAHARDGAGKIVEVRSCTPGGNWRSMIQFKLSDGNWFGVYSVHHGYEKNYGDTVDPGLIMLAFSADYKVNVRATDRVVTCGGIATDVMYRAQNDYIHVIK